MFGAVRPQSRNGYERDGFSLLGKTRCFYYLVSVPFTSNISSDHSVSIAKPLYDRPFNLTRASHAVPPTVKDVAKSRAFTST